MRLLFCTLLLASAGVYGAELSDEPSKFLEQLAACEVSWDDQVNSIETNIKVSEFFQTALVFDSKSHSFLPKEPMKVFGHNVVYVKTTFGMSPGYMVSVDAKFDEVTDSVEKSLKIRFECREQDRMCGKEITDTEAIAIAHGGDEVVLGCIYPYQK